MHEWQTTTIGAVATIFDGPHATPRTVDHGPVFLGISALQKGRLDLTDTRHVTAEDYVTWTRRVKPQVDDVVFSYETRIGEAAIIPEGLDCCLGRRMGLVRVDRSALDPWFFLYLYLAPPFQDFLRSRTIPGATVDRIALKEFPSFPIALPPLADQRRIVSTLRAIDDKIELNRRMNETLEALARAIFKDWFFDFGPTRAKMEGRPRYLAPDIWMLFPDQLDEHDVPRGWEWAKLSDLADLNPREKLRQGAVAPYLDMAALPTKGPSSDKPVQREAGSGTRFRNADTLMARITPCLENGKTALVRCLPDEQIGWGSTEFIVIRTKAPLPAEYGYLLARDEGFRAHAIQSMTGTSGRQRAQAEALARFDVVKPSEPVALCFGAQVAPMFEKIAANSQESETLAATRDLLLPKLMSGEIRIGDAEVIVAAAA